MAPTVVIDVNVHEKRFPEFAAGIVKYCRDGGRVAFSATGIYEMANRDQWIEDTRRTLGAFAPVSESVLVALPTGIARSKEIQSGRAVASMIDPAGSVGIQQLIRDLDDGAGPELGRLASFRKRFWPPEVRNHIQSFNASAVREIHRFAKPKISRSLASSIRTDVSLDTWDSLRRLMSEAFSVDAERASLARAFDREGIANGAALAESLCSEPSATAVYAVALGVVALVWEFAGGIPSAKDQTISGRVVDIDHLIAGLWVGTLVTDDAPARERFRDLQEIGAAMWPRHRDFFRDAWVGSPEDWICQRPW